MSNKPKSEDIDLLEILDFFWINKTKIISIAVLFSIIGLVFNTLFPMHYIATTEIREIKGQSHLPYALYVEQSTKSHQKSTLVDDNKILAQEKYYDSLKNTFSSMHGSIFSRDNLFISYIDKLSDFDHLKEVFSKKLYDEKDFTNSDAYEKAIAESANKLKIIVKRKKDALGNKRIEIENVTLEYMTADKDVYIQALSNLSNATTENVRLLKISQSKEMIKNYQIFKKMKVREINNEIEFLKLIKEDTEYHDQLKKVKNQLLDNSFEKDIEQFVYSSPISSKQNFTAVDFNPYATKFKESRSDKTLVIIFFLIGLIAGTLYAIVSRDKT